MTETTAPIFNVNVRGFLPLLSPNELLAEQPLSASSTAAVYRWRQIIKEIVSGQDPRVVVVVGPCSIHHEETAYEYARRLRALADRVADRMLLVMRVYFEKPRTTVGWKGLINDPHLDGSFDIIEGLRNARRILRNIADIGLPTASEFLDPIVPQYIADLVSQAGIGARTTESPTHRQMASGLSMPVGFKNGTDGTLASGVNAILAARSRITLGIDGNGRTAIVSTAGNPWGHVILRGGRSGPNYMPEAIQQAAADLHKAKLTPHLIVDCSHDNSNKDYRKQCVAWNSVIEQRARGCEAIMGLMLESNLVAGKQPLGEAPLKHGVSITDGCIGWEETEELITAGHRALGRAE